MIDESGTGALQSDEAVYDETRYLTLFARLSGRGFRHRKPAHGEGSLKVPGRVSPIAMAQSHPSRTECFFDGACPGNQREKKGPMRAAFVIGDQEYVRDVADLDTARGPLRSNNIAEYCGLIFLLRRLREIESSTGRRGAYVIYGDSQLVIRQMKGRYRVKADHLHGLNSEAKSLAAQLKVTFEEIPRTRNKAGFLLERRGRDDPR